MTIGGVLSVIADTSGVIDATAAIQAALDFAAANGIAEVRLPGGTYKTSDTIHVGRGDAFKTLALVGERSPPYRHATAGTKISPTATDRPAINIQGGRGSRVQGVGIKGLNYAQIAGMAAPWATPNTAAWLGGSIPNGLDRYRPYGAITIDAYSGTAPASPYPGTYGKLASSDARIIDCDISGFAVGICANPSATDGNCDFVKISGCSFYACIYAIAVCPSQSRNVEIRNCHYSWVHTFLTNGHFGVQGGTFGGPISNVSGGYSYQFMDVVSSVYFSSVTVDHLYCEVQGRIGVYGPGGSFQSPLTFQSCHFNLGEGLLGYSPDGLIQTGGQAAITFNGCTFAGFKRMLNLFKGGPPIATFTNNVIKGVADWFPSGSGFSAALARGVSFFGGLQLGTCTVEDGSLTASGNRGVSYDEGGVTYRERSFDAVVDRATSRSVCHLGATQFLDESGRVYTIKDRRGPVALPLSDTTNTFIVGVAVSGDTVTFRYGKLFQENYASLAKIEPGDILYFTQAGSIVVVTGVAVSGDTNYDITGKLMNNYTHSAGVYTSTADLAAAVGNVRLYHTGQQVGRMVWYGDFTSGSAIVTNVHRGDGYAGNISTYLAAGDMLAVPQRNDSFLGVPYPGRTMVQSVTNHASSGTVILDRNATATRRFPISSVLFA